MNFILEDQITWKQAQKKYNLSMLQKNNKPEHNFVRGNIKAILPGEYRLLQVCAGII